MNAQNTYTSLMMHKLKLLPHTQKFQPIFFYCSIDAFLTWMSAALFSIKFVYFTKISLFLPSLEEFLQPIDTEKSTSNLVKLKQIWLVIITLFRLI